VGIVPVPKVSIMNVNQGEGESQVPSKWLTLRDVQALDERAALGRPMLALRQEALTRFLSLPFPATNHELWRHTKTDLFDWEGLRNSSVVDFKLGLTESGSASAASTETLTSALPEGVTLSVDFSAYASQLGDLFGERALDLVERWVRGACRKGEKDKGAAASFSGSEGRFNIRCAAYCGSGGAKCVGDYR